MKGRGGEQLGVYSMQTGGVKKVERGGVSYLLEVGVNNVKGRGREQLGV